MLSGFGLTANALAADGSIRDSYRFYDELGRLTREVGPQTSSTDPNRPAACYVYTTLGDVKEIWAGSTTDTVSKTCTLDGVNIKKQLAATYDDFGRKLAETDPNGNTRKWNWNLHNQLVSSQTPAQIAAGQSTSYSYGAKGATGETQGLLKSRTVPGAQTASYTRDELGLVTKAETKNGSNSLVVSYVYTYDPAKRLNTVTDSRGNKTLSYTWTPGGRLSQVSDSDGHQASFSYDATGRLASVTAPNNETIAFTYDAGGRLIEQRANSGIKTTQTWFEDGGLKQKQNLYNAATLSNHVYTLDQQGRRAGQTETIAGTSKTWSYLYDNLDRLTSASDGAAETYGYDIWGNRRTKTKSGITTAYLYDAAHQLSEIRSGSDAGALTGAAVHDADGRMTKLCEVSAGGTVTNPTGDCTASGTGATTLQLVWDALDHLNAATRTGVGAIAESYAYDDSGRRIQKTSGATTANYLYDGDAIHAEWTGSSISGMPAAVYAHGAGVDEPLLRLTGTTNSPAATEAAYLQDGLGSVIGTASTAGTLTANQRFDAWGVKTASAGTTPTYGYTGREPDATGLMYYRARYYHPGIARFASRDPMGMVDAVSQYAYVGNNPINYTDPEGLCPSCIGAVGSVLLGGAIRGLTGGDIFDVGAIAADAALGAVGAGFANKLAQGAELAARASMATRAQTIHAAVGGARTQGATTVAITRSVDQSGRLTNIVTSSEGKLRPAQLAMLRPNEIAGSVSRSAAGHAEVNGLRVAESLGVNPAVTAASRPVCTGCEQALGEAGVGIASVLKSGNPMSIGLNLPSLSVGQSALIGAGVGQGTQALYDFVLGSSIAPYSGGVTIGVNPRASK